MQITGRDLEILRYVNRHGVVTAGQVAGRFFGTASAAYRRLKALTEAGYLKHDRVLFGQPVAERAEEHQRLREDVVSQGGGL